MSDRAPDGIKFLTIADLAYVLFQQGRLIQAERLFLKAEKMQRKSQPEYFFLYSYQGFRYCQLLLSLGRYLDVLERAKKMLSWSTEQGGSRDIALDHIPPWAKHL